MNEPVSLADELRADRIAHLIASAFNLPPLIEHAWKESIEKILRSKRARKL